MNTSSGAAPTGRLKLFHSRSGGGSAHTALLVCDVQECFREKMPGFVAMVQGTRNLCIGIQLMAPDAPIIFTEQYPDKLGKTVAELRALPDVGQVRGVQYYAKTQFSMITDEVKSQLYTSNVKQVILCGLETHVCVLQTAIDLLEGGYEVHVCVDAVCSQRMGDKRIALERLKQIGCFMASSEMLLFQGLKAKEHPAFKEISQLSKLKRDDTYWM